MNEGKQFEQDFIKSVPDEYFHYRFKDGTANFAGEKNENVRFQAHNICDFMVYTGKNLYLLELKSHKGKSIPKNAIRETQIKGLINAGPLVLTAFIINFRDIQETYYIPANIFAKEYYNQDRKSISLQFCREYGRRIEQTKLKVHYRYNLEFM